jgi:hypothetical protein
MKCLDLSYILTNSLIHVKSKEKIQAYISGVTDLIRNKLLV